MGHCPNFQMTLQIMPIKIRLFWPTTLLVCFSDQQNMFSFFMILTFGSDAKPLWSFGVVSCDENCISCSTSTLKYVCGNSNIVNKIKFKVGYYLENRSSNPWSPKHPSKCSLGVFTPKNCSHFSRLSRTPFDELVACCCLVRLTGSLSRKRYWNSERGFERPANKEGTTGNEFYTNNNKNSNKSTEVFIVFRSLANRFIFPMV